MPLVLFVLGIWMNAKTSAWQEDIAVTQMVDSYFDGVMSHASSTESDVFYKTALARSRSLFFHLAELDRKREFINVLRFISEVEPDLLRSSPFEQDPQAAPYHINLNHSDLSSSDIEIMSIDSLDFSSSNFERTNFYEFSCDDCSFDSSSFRNASFVSTSFSGSDLSNADFKGSNISNAYLEGAKLEFAIWSNGIVCAKGSIGTCD